MINREDFKSREEYRKAVNEAIDKHLAKHHAYQVARLARLMAIVEKQK